jgi:hypothetical protein
MVSINNIIISGNKLEINYKGSTPDPDPPLPTYCATKAQLSGNPLGFHYGQFQLKYPESIEIKDNTTIDEKLKENFIKGTASNVGVEGTKQISTIELAKVWILATHGLSKTWDNGDTVVGGFPTCSRAIATASTESGGAAPKTNSWDAGFFGPNSGCMVAQSGGCWQTSNAEKGLCKYLDNPYCSAIQVWGHRSGTSGTNQSPTACNSVTSDTKAGNCNVHQLTTTGTNPGCHFGALCYGSSGSAWNSPPRSAMFRMCSESPNNIPYTNTLPVACSPYDNVNTSCEIAQCSCKIALDELKKKYPSINFISKIDDGGYAFFTKACSLGRAYKPT